MKSPRMVTGFVVAVAVVTTVLVSGCGGDPIAVPSDPVAARGLTIAKSSCLGCHTVNGAKSSGPTFKGLYGRQVTLTDGRTFTADDTYLKKSIVDPDSEVVSGYPKTMGTAIAKGSISEEDAAALIAYIKTLDG